MTSSEATVQQAVAAWVQAIGVILGIIVTIIIFLRQGKQLRRQINADKLSLFEGILAIFDDVEKCLLDLSIRWEAKPDLRVDPFADCRGLIHQALSALNQLQWHEIRPYESMVAFLSAKKILADCGARLQSAYGPTDDNGNMLNEFREWARVFSEHRGVIEAQARLLKR